MALYEKNPKPGSTEGFNSFDPALQSMLIENPLVTFARSLFPDQLVTLPGLVILARLSQPTGALYVPLHEWSDIRHLARKIREVFTLVTGVIHHGGDFNSNLGTKLAGSGVRYTSSDPKSLQEHVIILLRYLGITRKI